MPGVAEVRARVLPVAPGSPLGAVILRRFLSLEPFLFDCCSDEGMVVYRLLSSGSDLALAVVEPGLELGLALGVLSCGYGVDLLRAIAVLPACRRHGWGRLFVQRLLRLHPRLVCVAAEGTEGFWRALAPFMVAHPGDGEGCRFVSAEVAAHVRACGLCWPTA
ncbi:MAG: hypothetical protein AB1816_19815 [Bacillota bacterium]